MEDWIKERVKLKCCACEKTLATSKYMNAVILNKIATWQSPQLNNILVQLPWNQALAYICDECTEIELGKHARLQIKYAVEHKDEQYIYHDINQLKDQFSLTEDIVTWCENYPPPRYWMYGPEELKTVIKKFISNNIIAYSKAVSPNKLTDKELSMVKWYLWQYYKGTNLTDEGLEKMLEMNEDELHRFVFDMLKKFNSDPL